MSLGTIGYTNIGRAHGERVLGPESNNEIVGQSIITANIGFDVSLKRGRRDIDGVMQLGSFRDNEELVVVPNEFMFYRAGSRGKTGVASGIDGFTSFNGLPIEDVETDDDLRRAYPYLGFTQGDTQLDEAVSVTRSGVAVAVAGSFTKYNDSKYTFTPGQVVRVVRPSLNPDKRSQQLAERRRPNHPDAPPLSKLTGFMEPFEIDQITSWFRRTGSDIFADLAKGSAGRYNVPDVMHDMDKYGKIALSDRDIVNVMRKQLAAASAWVAQTTAIRYGLMVSTAMNEHINVGGVYQINPLNVSSSQADANAYQTMLEQISLDNPHEKVLAFDLRTNRYSVVTLDAQQQQQRARAFDEVAKDLAVRYGLASDENSSYMVEDSDLIETTLLPTLGFASAKSKHINIAKDLFDKTLLPDRRNKDAFHTIQRNIRGSIAEQVEKSLRSAEEDYVRAVATIYDYFSTDIIGTASNHSRPGCPIHFAT